jgi:hypothetical protein
VLTTEGCAVCIGATPVFIESNGWTLKYPISASRNDLAQLADDCTANVVNLDGVKEWFRTHKIKIKGFK